MKTILITIFLINIVFSQNDNIKDYLLFNVELDTNEVTPFIRLSCNKELCLDYKLYYSQCINETFLYKYAIRCKEHKIRIVCFLMKNHLLIINNPRGILRDKKRRQLLRKLKKYGYSTLVLSELNLQIRFGNSSLPNY